MKASTPALMSMMASNGEHMAARAGTEAGNAVAIGFQAFGGPFHVTQAGRARSLPANTGSRGGHDHGHGTAQRPREEAATAPELGDEADRGAAGVGEAAVVEVAQLVGEREGVLVVGGTLPSPYRWITAARRPQHSLSSATAGRRREALVASREEGRG
jgi:hypothetical protein